MKPTISIVIPTKGRIECVNALAADLTTSAGYSSDKVSITVLDNATPSASYDLPKEVRLIVRSKSVSAIENILSGASICHGLYSWIIGDDDAFSRDIFARVFELINESEPGIIRLKHQYIETDDVIRSYEVKPGNQTFQNEYNNLFDWHCFSPSGINAYEDKAGFISGNIIRSDILEESLRVTRISINPVVYARNIYITKLYAVLALHLTGGYWASKEILVRQRIPIKGRYFAESGSIQFQSFVEAPAEVYRACIKFSRSYARLLLSIHFSKKVDYIQAAASDVPMTQCLGYIAQNFFYMGVYAGGQEFRRCLTAYLCRFFAKAKAFVRRIIKKMYITV